MDKLQLRMHNTDTISEEMQIYVDEIVTRWTSDLDIVMKSISEHINMGFIDDSTLQNIVLTLANTLYFSLEGLEKVGIKEDVCRHIREEVFIDARKVATGTVKDRDGEALLACTNEDMIAIIYSRAYKTIKQKVDAGYEMLNSIKKVMSKRMTEDELSNSRFINTQTERRSRRDG